MEGGAKWNWERRGGGCRALTLGYVIQYSGGGGGGCGVGGGTRGWVIGRNGCCKLADPLMV